MTRALIMRLTKGRALTYTAPNDNQKEQINVS